MSPELQAAMQDRDFVLALKRLYNFKRLRELGAPPVLIEKAAMLLDKSKREFGRRYGLVRDLFDEYRLVEEAAMAAEQSWETKCKTCKSWNGGANNGSDVMWCRMVTYDNRTMPEPCPGYEPKRDGN